jgi:hypothetical protein
MNIDTQLESIVERLYDAVNVCYNVDSRSDDNEQSYPYATGYSRSAMIGAAEDLRRIISDYRSITCEDIL